MKYTVTVTFLIFSLLIELQAGETPKNRISVGGMYISPIIFENSILTSPKYDDLITAGQGLEILYARDSSSFYPDVTLEGSLGYFSLAVQDDKMTSILVESSGRPNYKVRSSYYSIPFSLGASYQTHTGTIRPFLSVAAGAYYIRYKQSIILSGIADTTTSESTSASIDIGLRVSAGITVPLASGISASLYIGGYAPIYEAYYYYENQSIGFGDRAPLNYYLHNYYVLFNGGLRIGYEF